jgi:hypothetical protein
MSWVIEITHVPVVAKAADAWRQLDFLRTAEAGREYGSPPSEPLRRLHDRLTERYPCITVDPDSPWSDGPFLYNFGDLLATIGIRTSRIEDALPVVVQTATEMGMTVFDAGDGKIHRPGGGR